MAAKKKFSELPQVPAEIAIFDEGSHYAFREADSSKTIYVYDKDNDGKSHCDAACTHMWPPVVAPPNAKPIGDWTLIERAPLTKQWAYKGKPVYTNANDAAEQTKGDGIDGLWHIFEP